MRAYAMHGAADVLAHIRAVDPDNEAAATAVVFGYGAVAARCEACRKLFAVQLLGIFHEHDPLVEKEIEHAMDPAHRCNGSLRWGWGL